MLLLSLITFTLLLLLFTLRPFLHMPHFCAVCLLFPCFVRAELLCAVFFLMACLCYIEAAQRGGGGEKGGGGGGWLFLSWVMFVWASFWGIWASFGGI